MNMLHPTTALEKVREGFGHVIAPHNGKSHKENLIDFVEKGLTDQEEAQLAIIRGTKGKAAFILFSVYDGFEHTESEYGRTFGEELRELVNRGYIDQGDAHKAIIEGRKKRIIGE